MNFIEAWIAQLAVISGVIIIALPLIRILQARHVPRGRSSGSQARLLGWSRVLASTLAAVAAGALLWKPIPTRFDPRLEFAFSVAGALFYFPGLAIYGWGFLALGSMFGVSSAMAAELYKEHRLVARGPYRFVRHPMYLGVILAALGALLIFRTWAMVVFAPLSTGVVFRAKREESLLAEEFGETWEAYTRRVPAWLPRIHPGRKKGD